VPLHSARVYSASRSSLVAFTCHDRLDNCPVQGGGNTRGLLRLNHGNATFGDIPTWQAFLCPFIPNRRTRFSLPIAKPVSFCPQCQQRRGSATQCSLCHRTTSPQCYELPLGWRIVAEYAARGQVCPFWESSHQPEAQAREAGRVPRLRVGLVSVLAGSRIRPSGAIIDMGS